MANVTVPERLRLLTDRPSTAELAKAVDEALREISQTVRKLEARVKELEEAANGS